MHQLTLSSLGVLFAAVSLSACDPRDPPAPKVDEPTAEKVERKLDDMKADARREIAEFKEKARAVGRDAEAGGAQASEDLKQAGDKAGDKVADAVITTTVNAEFARDTGLSATKIDVDTAGGHVALRGSAPNQAARDRATQIASHVKGVRSVDNQLSVEPARM